MPQSLSKVLIHVVYSTKNRESTISKEIMPKLHAYLAGICRSIKAEAYRVGGTDDHVHIACGLPRTLTISKLLEEVKKSSSFWMKQQDVKCKSFFWQAGYGAFSVDFNGLPDLIRYIDQQHEHHRKRTFKEEYLELLRDAGVEYNEKYIWD